MTQTGENVDTPIYNALITETLESGVDVEQIRARAPWSQSEAKQRLFVSRNRKRATKRV
jgi:hypothetical protein